MTTLARCASVPHSRSRSPLRAASPRSRDGSAPAAGRRSRASSSPSSTAARSTASPRGSRRERRSSRPRTARRPRRRWRPRSSVRGTGSRTMRPARTSSRASPRRCSAPETRTSGCSRWTRARCPSSCNGCGRRAVCLGNLFRDQLDRYGELELVAERWREAVAALPAEAQLVYNADDPQLAAVGRGARAQRRLRPRRSERGPCRRCSTRPTRSTASAAARRTTTPRRTSATSATTAARAATTLGRRWRSRRGRSRCRGSSVPRSGSTRPEGSRRIELGLPGLYNVYNAVGGGGARPRARRRRSTRSRPGSSASPPRSAASSASPSARSGSSCC